MRVDDDTTVTIVDPAGTPIPYYKPFTPPQRYGEDGNGAGTDPQWWSTIKRRTAEVWSSATSRWASNVRPHDDEPAGRWDQPAGTK
jgi:hypothetical protein